MAMIRDDIIHMAREAGIPITPEMKPQDALAIAFSLGAVAEREACALILDNCEMERTYTHEMAKMIRARGQ